MTYMNILHIITLLQQCCGSGIGFSQIPDPKPIFLELVTIFRLISIIVLSELAQIFSLPVQNILIFNFVICGYKKKISPSYFVNVVGCGIRDPGCIKIRIWDKHAANSI
jgi:hypothetical protein